MNKLVCSLLTIVLAFAFASCEKEIINNGGKEKQGKSKFKTISFRINEEITTSETPLFAYTRGAGKKLYGINVYQKRANSNSYSKFAYGLFDDPSKISIALNENCLYRFECLIVEEGEDGIYLSADGYMEPFVTTNAKPVMATNSFTKSSSVCFAFPPQGQTTVTGNKQVWSPKLVKQYGTLIDFDPKTSDSVLLKVKRAVFGIHLTITPPEDGTLEVSYLDDYTETVKASDPIFDHQAIYSFSQVAKAIEDSYSGEVDFIVKWTKNDGTIRSEIKKVVLKRNVMTNIKIVVKTPTPSSIAIEEEGNEMSNENVEWTINE
ncbi:hypothetical protein [Prevotella pallens]|uniref:Fimbrillin-A associated anchor proteins Mfa1 and Mfa2 n=2 Tax=Prevotella pallens TaxID=60133 RepID=A0ABX9DS00_9BACT|nr:hypothetical protein [Prevotella pallens]EGQ19626.1 hypothetical protein HMPREF9144_0908 [Prevotella pallens ATCC 700821]RAS46383.1 hypothetical protein BC673_10663 [Prevotella pallens]